MAERAGAGRAREFVMSGDLYDAATLERWGVVNRVLPDAELAERTLEFARRLASGPTLAHAATKRVVRAYLRGRRTRRRRARRRRSARRSSRRMTSRARSRASWREGPGKATFEGR